MTMTDRAELPAPPDPATYHDPNHPIYGFHTERWYEMPTSTTKNPWFTDEEIYRRQANAHAYRQHGNPHHWRRYLTLGYFVYDDCSKFDALWMKYSSDPVTCHRMVWYNFLYHVDRHYDIDHQLEKWATEVSQPYLQRHAPQYLAINTLTSSWSDVIRGEHDVMAIEANEWNHVGTRNKTVRSSSPHGPSKEQTTGDARKSRYNHGQRIIISDGKNSAISGDNLSKNNNQGTHDQQPLDPAILNNNSQVGTSFIGTQQFQSSSHTDMTNDQSTAGKQSALQDLMTVPTNDGTYRLTIRWSPKDKFKQYKDQPGSWLPDMQKILSDLFPASVCSFYRWESQDLTMSSVMSELPSEQLRDFLSPNITFIDSTEQIIFGARACFVSTYPGKWRRQERTLQLLTENNMTVSISNSTTTSGRIVTAGYLLFKAPRTTHRTRFLQSLRMRLPNETPYFDILFFQRTPTEQKINHLVVQCGENHVSPLSMALSELLTGRNSALYLPRLAFSKLTTGQISSYFDMHDRYTKSLKSLPLYPMLTNLDKLRQEHQDDGSILERSTREWASTLFAAHSDISARCEVVNGGIDQKAYLLVPGQHFQAASEYLRQYRLRLNPIGRREARFRDSLPGLPEVIHIDISTQHNLDLLANMSSMEVWKNAPAAVREGDQSKRYQQNGKPQEGTNPASVLTENSPKNGGGNGRKTSRNPKIGADHSMQAPPDMESDDQTNSTHSATQSAISASMMSNTTTRRLKELEALFRSQQKESSAREIESKQAASRLSNIETKLSRIDQLESALQDNSEKLVLTMERQQDTHVQLIDLNLRVSRLTDVMDRMATQLETLTSVTNREGSPNERQGTPNTVTIDGTRRRSLDEMTISSKSQVVHTSEVSQPTAPFMPLPDSHTQNNKSSDKVFSPSKKKSRSLQAELEEMSLGSNEASDTTSMKSTTISTQRQVELFPSGEFITDELSDEFSTNDEEILPDLDAQYTIQSDPEGGDSV